MASGHYKALQRYAPILKPINLHTPKSINNIIIVGKLANILNFLAPKHFRA